jgi:hypothetical protein
VIDCDGIRPMLTGYLDGDLDGDAGTVVRGHLRECNACRDVAETEAALRDGLRALPSLDPPPGMWNAVRAQLAEAEVAESHRPAWRRALARWTPAVRTSVPYAGVLAAAALAVIVWRTRHDAAEPANAPTANIGEPHTAPVGPSNITTPDHHSPEQPRVAPPSAPSTSDADVTADLARDASRRDDSLRDSAADLERQLADVRATWPDDRKREFDAHLAELHRAVDAAHDVRPHHTALRAMIRYLQNALVRDEVALADVGPGAGGTR